MATRSRRSGAGSDTLNPAMIYLLGTGRLKKELEQRGLDITGNKNLLADRLQQAVDLERMGHHSYSPPPVTEKCPRKTATKRTAKAKAQVEVSENEVLADESEPVITSPQAKKKKVDQSEAERIEEIEIVEESFSIEFSDETSTDLNAVAGVSSLPSEKPADLEAPVNNTKKSQSKSKKTSPTRKKPSTKKSSHQRLSKDDSTEAPAAHRTRRSSEEMKLEIAEENESTDSTDSEQEEQLGLKLKIDMKNKKIEKEKSVTKVRKEKEAEKNCSAENESNDSKPKKGLVLKLKLDLNKSIRMSESEPKKAPPSVLIKTVTVDSDSETSKAASGSERSSAKEEGESSKLVIKLPSDRSCGSASPLSQISPSNSSTDMSKGKQQSSESGAVDKSKVLSSDAEKKKASLSRKKIPLRMQAPIDVLDSIFDKQTELLSSKFKTEQEKADERQKIEMEKRRLSGASNIGLGPMIDRRKYPLTSQQHQPSQHHSPISPRFSTHPQKNRSLSDDRMQQLSRLPAPPPPPNLSSLPPPPPPPPALPPSRLPPPPPPPKPTYANVTPIEDALLSPLSRPPSVPPYSSPTPASASIKHYPDVPSTSAIASQLSSSDLSPDRIKEMASALQAVFARIGDANSMKLPISNDDDAAVNDYSFDSLQLSSSSFLQQHANRRLDELRTSSDLAETEAETPNSDSIVDDAKVEPSSSNVFIPPPAATHLIPLPQTEPTANLLTSNILEVIPLPDDVDRQRSPPNELISMPVVSAPITTPIDTSLSNYQSDESKPMSTANVTKQQTVQSTAVIDHNISVDSDECAISKPNSDDEIRRDVSTTLNSVLQMASGSGETKLTPLALNEDVNMTDETRAQSSDELPIPSSSCEMSQLEKDVRSILMEVVATVVASYELLSFNENVLHFSSSNSSEEEHPKENISDEASISPNTVSTDQDKESTNDSTANSTSKEPGTESKPDICEKLLRDPRLLLQKASAVLKNLTSQENVNEEHGQHYEQITPDPDYEIPEEDKPLPEFHGEPVPDSDDDIIIEGVSKRKSNAAKKNSVQEEEPIPGDEHVELDFYNADLHIKASETDRMIIDPDNGDGFALMWGGVRSTYGIRVPRQFDDSFPVTVFQAKVLEHLTMKHIPFEEVDAYDARIGWSLQNTQTILGESAHSYSFSLTARKALGNVFTDYGEPFQIGDIITTAVDLAKGEISYWINKQWMGVAFSEVHLMPDEALFPHICTKNCKVAVNFGNSKADDWIDLSELNRDNSKQEQQQQKLTFIDHVSKDKLVRGPVAPSSKNECTVLMMVGLPGVGKTTWVRQYLKDHPHEQWTLISTDVILAAMKINGVARSRVHQGRWDMVMGLTAKALTRSLHLACRRRRNYIIDQTNVSKDARRKKLSQFKDFQRKCVVIIPKEEEMLNRQIRQSRADGFGQIPVEAMLELKATFTIPNIETEPIEDVYFVEPPIERISDAIEIVRRFNEEARPWCQKKRGRRGGGGGGGDNRRSYGSRSNENRQFSFNSNRRHSSDSAAPKQSSHAQPRPKEGYCGFGGAMPPSMVPTSTLWAEHKSTSN